MLSRIKYVAFWIRQRALLILYFFFGRNCSIFRYRGGQTTLSRIDGMLRCVVSCAESKILQSICLIAIFLYLDVWVVGGVSSYRA